MAKYKPFPQVPMADRKWPNRTITEAPIWCSVDLRDGNQALPVPMDIHQKLEMFALLVDTGFKEIEIGFPSASQIEYEFLRKLIDDGHIPDDVYVQVLTQAREHLIRKTIESVKGAPNSIIHLYNSTSALQRKITFQMSKDEIRDIAVRGTELIVSMLPELSDSKVKFEYSPESFTGTELEYALEVCEAVIEVWNPDENGEIILNLPATVEMSTPNVYADMIEWFSARVTQRENVIISLHTHNDRGTGVAATELALLAGAQRVEGTLFGNGERTGNLDIVTVALNMFSQGVDPELDFTNLPNIQAVYERTTGMHIPERQPYSGELVFTAFSGSHQDAIKKGMDRQDFDGQTDWEVPYLPIDPKDIGRTYKAIIRINSQSGKGGVSYVLSRNFGLEIPKTMHPQIGQKVNAVSDKLVKELTPEDVYQVFSDHFLNLDKPLELLEYGIHADRAGHVSCTAEISYSGEVSEISGEGNGPIDAFVHAMQSHKWNSFSLIDFHEQAIGSGSGTEAAAYIMIQTQKGEFWGAGRHTDSTAAGLHALVSAYNRSVLGT